MTNDPNPTTDSDIIDDIAALLGTAEDWSPGSDFLEIIADLIGQVRPHPGEGSGTEYPSRFKQVTGRNLPDTE